MVSDTLALLIYKLVNVFIKVILSGSRAAAPKGTKSCKIQGEFLFIRSSVHPSVPPFELPRLELGPQRPDLGPQSMDAQTDERMEGQKFPLCSTGLCPLWGRCPASTQNHLNKYINQYINEQGKGIADHILPLGD